MGSTEPLAPSVEVLVFEGCPNVALAIERIQEAADSIGMQGVEAKVVWIRDTDEAHAMRFLGSPSVRVNGRDVESEAEAKTSFGLQCRVYELNGELHRAPPLAVIAAALMRARRA